MREGFSPSLASGFQHPQDPGVPWSHVAHSEEASFFLLEQVPQACPVHASDSSPSSGNSRVSLTPSSSSNRS